MAAEPSVLLYKNPTVPDLFSIIGGTISVKFMSSKSFNTYINETDDVSNLILLNLLSGLSPYPAHSAHALKGGPPN